MIRKFNPIAYRVGFNRIGFPHLNRRVAYLLDTLYFHRAMNLTLLTPFAFRPSAVVMRNPFFWGVAVIVSPIRIILPSEQNTSDVIFAFISSFFILEFIFVGYIVICAKVVIPADERDQFFHFPIAHGYETA